MTGKQLPFYKIHASGNDFVLLASADCPPQSVAPSFSLKLCDRHHGIGADGLMIYDCDQGSVRLAHFDPDGSRSLCLNGTRAALKCLSQLGLAPKQGEVFCENQAIRYQTDDRVSMILQTYEYKKHHWKHHDLEVPGYFVDVGNPHFCFIDGPDLTDLPSLAPLIRGDLQAFPNGVNVHRLWQEDHVWRIRSFERGVEDFTLACGSGMLAAAIVLMGEGYATPIHFQPDGNGPVTCIPQRDTILMQADAVIVAKGDYYLC